ncbi:30S ribosomal protein S1 [candidate division WOR-3 bacterium]|nr:30S ribosomal protein S1 [candidate division WOR-3 bacterium]
MDEDIIGMIDESMKIKEGEIIKGKVVKVTGGDVLVDVGLKSEGIIPSSEFKKTTVPDVGDEVLVLLEKIENDEGMVVLSKEKADIMHVWNTVRESYEAGGYVEGKIVKTVKGGFQVDLGGINSFLPGSQVDFQPVSPEDYIGTMHNFKILKLSEGRKNIVISRRAILEEDMEKKREETWEKVEKGAILEGKVKNITDYGAFIDLGGVDGLLHIGDITWGRLSHASEVLKIGDTIKVLVLDCDREQQRIALGRKHLSPHPWEDIDKKYKVGSIVTGKAVSITDYGAFVELEPGVEGLVHISEFSWTQKVRKPSEFISLGDIVEVKILSVDKEQQRMSLSIRSLVENPWVGATERHPVGSSVKGIIRKFTNYGAFVELEDGIEGLLHIKDISWTKRISHPADELKSGQEVECRVLSIDQETHRLSVGLKQIEEDPLKKFVEEHAIGDIIPDAIITRVLDKGIVVDIGVEGFVPYSQMQDPPSELRRRYSIGDNIAVRLIEINEEKRRLIFSQSGYEPLLEKEKGKPKIKREDKEEKVVKEKKVEIAADKEKKVEIAADREKKVEIAADKEKVGTAKKKVKGKKKDKAKVKKEDRDKDVKKDKGKKKIIGKKSIKDKEEDKEKKKVKKKKVDVKKKKDLEEDKKTKGRKKSKEKGETEDKKKPKESKKKTSKIKAKKKE